MAMIVDHDHKSHWVTKLAYHGERLRVTLDYSDTVGARLGALRFIVKPASNRCVALHVLCPHKQGVCLLFVCCLFTFLLSLSPVWGNVLDVFQNHQLNMCWLLYPGGGAIR